MRAQVALTSPGQLRADAPAARMRLAAEPAGAAPLRPASADSVAAAAGTLMSLAQDRGMTPPPEAAPAHQAALAGGHSGQSQPAASQAHALADPGGAQTLGAGQRPGPGAAPTMAARGAGRRQRRGGAAASKKKKAGGQPGAAQRRPRGGAKGKATAARVYVWPGAELPRWGRTAPRSIP